MEKMTLEIYLPGVNEAFTFALPSQVPIGAMIGELVKVVAACSGNARVDEDHPMLLSAERGAILDRNKTLAENGVVEGARLLLV